MSIPSRYGQPSFGAVGSSDLAAPIAHTFLKYGVYSIFITITFFAYLGIGIRDDFSLGLGAVAIYIVLVCMMLNENISVDGPKLLGYISFVCSVLLTFLSATSSKVSTPSMMYLFFLYLPFIFTMSRLPLTNHMYPAAVRFFLNCTSIVAIVAIVQFVSQFIVRAPWIFNISSLIPSELVDKGAWNTSIEAGGFLKSNGFFLREPSELSMFVGIAALIEIVLFRRLIRLCIYSVAMVVSFSGTGMFLVAVGLLVPTRLKAVRRAVVLMIIGLVVIPLFDGYVLDGYFLHRLDEFNREGTSAWSRFIAPQIVVDRGMDSLQSTIFGNGSGTISTSLKQFGSIFYDGRFTIFDPTWAKLLYEYGLIGTAIAVAFISTCLWRSRAPIELKIGVFYGWLASGGQLLSPSYCAIMFGLISVWPKSAKVRDRYAR